jgi:hypothetical protein
MVSSVWSSGRLSQRLDEHYEYIASLYESSCAFPACLPKHSFIAVLHYAPLLESGPVYNFSQIAYLSLVGKYKMKFKYEAAGASAYASTTSPLSTPCKG